jgi:hypothetical protein
MYTARINCNYNERWNETLARAVETFGLPGDRYCTTVNINSMDLHFKDEQDRLLFLIGWPAYIPKDIDEN